jgi:hypothetical protein
MKSPRNSDYLHIGIKYYVIGRFATLSFLSPNAGNLFHHGFEILFKAKLLAKYSPDDLQKKFGHNLTVLWELFKCTTKKDSLSKYDSLISEIQKWEEIRYPNYPSGRNTVMTTMVGRRQKLDQVKNTKTHNYYVLFLDEVDELFKNVIDNWPIDPKYVRLVIEQGPFSEALKVYEDRNNFKIW